MYRFPPYKAATVFIVPQIVFHYRSWYCSFNSYSITSKMNFGVFSVWTGLHMESGWL